MTEAINHFIEVIMSTCAVSSKHKDAEHRPTESPRGWDDFLGFEGGVMLYVPRHLSNKLEYKVLSCISVHYQSRMTSNGIAITCSHPLTVQAG